jgi:two-component system OmpR family sensor kinase
MKSRGRDYLYIVDDHGHELLGRAVPAADHLAHRPTREVSLPDGTITGWCCCPGPPLGLPGDLAGLGTVARMIRARFR